MHFPTTLLSLLPLLLGTAVAIKPIEQWWVQNFTRDCTNPNVCTYYFTLNSGDYLQHCTTVDVYTPAGNHSWYDHPCQENPNFHISWGWAPPPQDFTVMTIVKQDEQKEAFFGYNSPNSVNPIAAYPNVGPNAVQWTGVKPEGVVG